MHCAAPVCSRVLQFSGLPLGGPHWSTHQALHIAFSSGVRPELADSHLLSGTAGVVGSAGVAVTQEERAN